MEVTQLKNMEDELGKQLLIRGTKGSRKVIQEIIFGIIDRSEYDSKVDQSFV